jgi:hypothetical protein
VEWSRSPQPRPGPPSKAVHKRRMPRGSRLRQLCRDSPSCSGSAETGGERCSRVETCGGDCGQLWTTAGEHHQGTRSRTPGFQPAIHRIGEIASPSLFLLVKLQGISLAFAPLPLPDSQKHRIHNVAAAHRIASHRGTRPLRIDRRASAVTNPAGEDKTTWKVKVHGKQPDIRKTKKQKQLVYSKTKNIRRANTPSKRVASCWSPPGRGGSRGPSPTTGSGRRG